MQREKPLRRRVNGRRLIYLGVLAFVGSAWGCSQPSGFSTVPPTDTAQTNAARKKIGIRQIKQEWTFYGRQFLEESWKDGTNLCKKVARDHGGALLWEEDYHYSGATFEDDDGTFSEKLTINYDYSTRLIYVHYSGVNPAITALFPPLFPANLNLKSADKVLATWGMTRL